MLRLLADENFNGIIFEERRRHGAGLDLLRAQDVGLGRVQDPHVLEWAAAQGRVPLTHDKRTIPGYVYDRVERGLPMPGVIELLPPYSVRQAVDDILIVATSMSPNEISDRIIYLPL